VGEEDCLLTSYLSNKEGKKQMNMIQRSPNRKNADKPWTKEHATNSDWFNFGFDEESFTQFVNVNIRERFDKKLVEEQHSKNNLQMQRSVQSEAWFPP